MLIDFDQPITDLDGQRRLDYDSIDKELCVHDNVDDGWFSVAVA